MNTCIGSSTPLLQHSTTPVLLLFLVPFQYHAVHHSADLEKFLLVMHHAFSYILCAGNLRARHPVDDRFSVLPKLRLAIGPEPRKSHFDQTHPAIARRAKLFVIAIPRHENANPFARLDHAHALRKLMPDTVDLDVEYWSTRIGHI